MMENESSNILPRPSLLEAGVLEEHVRGFLKRRDEFLSIASDRGSPLYILERDVLVSRARRFRGAFEKSLPRTSYYFAMKSNNLPAVAGTLIGGGFGIDVSSGLELQAALDLGARDIVFSGPGKTSAELRLAAENAGRVTILIDSFDEAGRIDEEARANGAIIRAGVRLTSGEHGLWRKFGIPIEELGRFFRHASGFGNVRLRGLQFHSSWNMDPGKQTAFIARVGEALAGLPSADRGLIEFIDIGGGYWPPQGEWLHPPGIMDRLEPGENRMAQGEVPDHRWVGAAPIEEFASSIGDAARRHIFPQIDCRICLEPGRWVCNDAMHMLFTVIDRKGDGLVITDAGTNAIGWERFETDYFPILNLSRPGLTERGCLVLGSLCTPHDVWGFSYFGEGVGPGDVLLLPCQGAYTYSLRQQFIKPLPAVVIIGDPD
ncbi:MAG: alanine racemase [Candidatus Krumholzibacteria bacterium]|nr:alanine racemase [Candidatus Krumholzibacteria bacterium]